MTEKESLRSLIDKYQSGRCSDHEIALLESWYLQFNEQDRLTSSEDELLKATNKLREELGLTVHKPVKIIQRRKLGWIAAAIFFIATGIYMFYGRPQAPVHGLAVVNDIAPGKNRATITRSNGEVLSLSEKKSGLQVQGAKLAYQDGTQLDMWSREAKLDENELLTAATPLGGTYQIILPDGTHVWLNAGSSIRFPVKFTGSHRQVELTGEAYFQVAKNKKQPFIVSNDGQQVEVLGTHFNINSYMDEDAIKTTLLEGVVKVNNTQLRPGQQSVMNRHGIRVVEANTEEAIAWKNGYFRFDNEDIESIMRKLSRWYNVSVVYKGDFTEVALNGTISRSKNIREVLELLQLTRLVHFEVEGRRVTVTQ